jgi:ferredoxin
MTAIARVGGVSVDTYISGELDESLRDDVEEAADACPLQAITVD